MQKAQVGFKKNTLTRKYFKEGTQFVLQPQARDGRRLLPTTAGGAARPSIAADRHLSGVNYSS